MSRPSRATKPSASFQLSLKVDGLVTCKKQMCSEQVCCELTLTHDVTPEGGLILAGKHSSQVHICAMEYWQLVTTCACANLSQINANHRSELFSLRQHTTQFF